MFGRKNESTQDYKQKALQYFDTQVKNMYGNGALTWLRGGLELAQEIGLLSATEVEQINNIGTANFEAIQKAKREEKERVVAQHKAERAAAAKKAKGVF